MPDTISQHLHLVESPPARTEKVVAVTRCVEGDGIGAEEPFEQLAAPGQAREDLGRREGNVEEEANRAWRAACTQELREQHQLVVVNPAHSRDVRVGIREALVGGAIRLPPAWLEHRLLDEPMEERPERSVGEPVVRPFDLPTGQRHGLDREVEPFHPIGNVAACRVPPHPDRVAVVESRAKRGHQPTVGRPPALGAAANRQPVRERDERPRTGVADDADRRVPFTVGELGKSRSATDADRLRTERTECRAVAALSVRAEAPTAIGSHNPPAPPLVMEDLGDLRRATGSSNGRSRLP